MSSFGMTRAFGDAATNSGLVEPASAGCLSGEPPSELGRMLRDNRHQNQATSPKPIRAQMSDDDCIEQQQQQSNSRARGFEFKPFTRESLRKIKRRRERRLARVANSSGANNKKTTTPASNQNNNNNQNQSASLGGPVEAEPDPYLASGQQLPPVLARQFPPELVGRPIEDIDPYYAESDTFVIISRGRELTRFSASKALCLFGPFHPIRRIALCIQVNPIFNLLVMLTIVTNCILMTLKGSDSEEKTEYIFTIVYTTEMGLKVLARGFIIEKFTYLRDPWNWLDFAVIVMAYTTIVVEDLGNLSVMRTFRVLRALKTVAIIPGMKTIVGAVIDSVKNLKDVVVLTLFSLSVFSLSGLQIYMGQLTQKCILDGPTNMSSSEWFTWANESTHWVPEPNSEIPNSYRLCGNATGAQSCPINHTCLQGFGPNPDYGFTNFDTFGWSLICSFRLMTQDYWEGLYMQLLKTAGSWHIIYFIISIFLGSIYLMNLILAIVAMSYNELQRRAEEEEEAAAEEEAAFLESCRQMELDDLYYFDNQTKQQQDYNSVDGRKSSAVLSTSSFRNDSFNNNNNINNSTFRPSIEIDLVDQSLLVADLASKIPAQEMNNNEDDRLVSYTHVITHSNKDNATTTTIESNQHNDANKQQQYLRPDRNTSLNPLSSDACNQINSGNNNTCLRSHSLTGGETQFSQHNRDQTRQLANPGDINRAEAVHPNLVASMTELRHNSTTGLHAQDHSSAPRYSATGHHLLIRALDQPINYKYDNTDSGNLRSASRTSIRSRKARNKYALSRLIASQNSDSESKLIELRRRAATIRIVSDDYSNSEVEPIQVRDQSGNNQSIDLEDHHNKQLYHHTQRQASVGQIPSDNQFQACNLGQSRPRFTSDSVICEQPKSIINDGPKQASEDSNNRQSQQQLAAAKRRQQFHEANATKRVGSQLSWTDTQAARSQSNTPSNKSLESAMSSTIVGDSKVAISLSGRKESVESMLYNNQQSTSKLMINQLGRDLMNRAARSDHHLSVENFYKFGLNLSDAQQSHEPPHHQHLSTSTPTTATSPTTRDMMIPGVVGSPMRLGGPDYIHPNVMARSSFARPRASLMPDSLHASHLARLSVVGANSGGRDSQNNPNNGARRLSHQDYMRRASNWSRLSMNGNTDMRRLLRLWAHTNPYQINKANYPPNSRGSPANSIVSKNDLNMQYLPTKQQSFGKSPSAYSNNNYDLNSPRPSSVGSIRQAYELISALSRRRSRYGFDQRYGLAGLDGDPNDMLAYDQVSVTFRDKCLASCLSCLDALCIWECCDMWLRIQKLISLVVFDPFTELFIILCILINTLFMALDSDDAGEEVKSFLDRGNYFFTATFAVEASMKIMALSPKFYFREGWNVFDAIIVGLSLLELGLEGVYGLSVLRSFRLLRVFKLAKSWPTLNLLISIMGKAIGDLGNLTFVLAIIVFIFAVMGMQLFGNKYTAEGFHGELPRWNFTDFMHSFMIVFRILCAEWIEPMWDCLQVGGWPCIPFFLIAVTVGNLVVLNLFLALLLASFGASNLSSPQSDNVDTKKLNEAIERFRRFGRWSRRCLRRLCRLCIQQLRRSLGFRNKDGAIGSGGGDGSRNADRQHGSQSAGSGRSGAKSAIVAMSRLERKKNIEIRTELLRNRIRNSGNNCPQSPESRKHHNLSQLAQSHARKWDSHNHHLINFNQNYHYPIAHHHQHHGESGGMTRNCPGAKQQTNYRVEIHSSQNVTSSPDHHSRCNQPSIMMSHHMDSPPTNTIPIIINEASESNDESDLNGHLSPGASATSSLAYNAADNSTSGDDNSSSYSNNNMQQQQLDNSREPVLQPIREADSSANSEAESISLNLINSDKDDEDDEDDDIVQRNALHQQSGGKPDNNQSKYKLGKQTNKQSQQPVKKQASGDKNNKTTSIQEQKSTSAGEQPAQNVGGQLKMVPDMEEEDERTLLFVESYIERCVCLGIICLKFFLFRRFVRKIVEHRYFDQAILALIVISSSTLALEDKHLNDRPLLKRTLDALDTVFTIVFSLEMVLKWLAFGIRRYFSNLWSWLDFLIVVVSFINLMASIFGSGKIQALKTMRTLRAMRGLRPLRALQRFQGMRVVVNALIQAIPSIFNVLLVCLIFWLIFSIMGVQMFGGKFWRCIDPLTGELVSEKLVDNKQQCLERNLTWSNPQINFDNVLNAYLALFQVAIFKGWIEIMNSATDSRGRDDQPIREANIYMYFYFVFFVIFGSFFTLNLFIGVIIDNFNEQKKKTGGSLEIFMTDDQKKYYHAMKKMKSKRPIKAMTRPKFKLQAILFDITTSRKFDMTIMIIIGINMFVMAMEHYGQSQEFSIILENLNLLFIAIFTLECLCKIFAMRHFYFREPWNIFDFIVVCLSILGVVMKEYVAKYFVSPTLLRVVRVVKVGRVLRLVKGAKGIRTLLFALAMSLPALFNICLLLFLVMFIYAIFGMSFFMNVRKRAGLDETFNFETFTSSIIVLFQMSTSAGFEVVLDPLMDEENDCQKPDPARGIEGTCGNKTIAILYLMSYVIVTFLIIINMYIAVILENYSQATEDVQEGLTDDDYEMYYEIWQKFDPNGTQFLTIDKLSDFLDALEDPLRIAKPNDLAIVVLDINIYEGNRCYCVDILDALTKNFFARKGLNIQVNEHLEKVQSSIIHETKFQKITSTYMMKREHYCARLIQNSWRRWRQACIEKKQ